jgi:hypothetical protein
MQDRKVIQEINITTAFVTKYEILFWVINLRYTTSTIHLNSFTITLQLTNIIILNINRKCDGKSNTDLEISTVELKIVTIRFTVISKYA